MKLIIYKNIVNNNMNMSTNHTDRLATIDRERVSHVVGVVKQSVM